MSLWQRTVRWIGQVYYNQAGWNRYGLIYDDLRIVNDDVREALSRLPPSVLAARDRRIKTAFDLSLKHKHLPKENWTTIDMERDLAYLEPTLSEVMNEVRLRKKFRAQ